MTPYQQRYPCNVCGKSYLRKAHLKRHVTNECIGVPPKFACEYCSSRYKRKEDLKRHMLMVHKIDLRKTLQSKNNYSLDDMPLSISYYGNTNAATQPHHLQTSNHPHSSIPQSHHHHRRRHTSLEPHFDDQAYFLDF
ncbi:isoforms A/B/D/L, Longitudinals lacking protein [Lucilia cuprina]|nr:isoforms A/B/D/L, Longitudinals lacking protein [Lucilia cuprina]